MRRDLPGGFVLNDDPARLDLDAICRFLSEESYWALGRDHALIRRAIAHSLPVAAYAPDGALAAFAMAVSDRAVFALLSNVFVLPAYRGRGLGAAVVRGLLEHPELATVLRWSLQTDDAHGLYEKFGFVRVRPDPKAMEWRRGAG